MCVCLRIMVHLHDKLSLFLLPHRNLPLYLSWKYHPGTVCCPEKNELAQPRFIQRRLPKTGIILLTSLLEAFFQRNGQFFLATHSHAVIYKYLLYISSCRSLRVTCPHYFPFRCLPVTN